MLNKPKPTIIVILNSHYTNNTTDKLSDNKIKIQNEEHYIRYISVSSFLSKFKLAYCITIHKSQGMEYDTVVIIVAKCQEFFLNKKLIYTALTRAKNIILKILREKYLKNFRYFSL